jgi:translation initiation factor 6
MPDSAKNITRRASRGAANIHSNPSQTFLNTPLFCSIMHIIKTNLYGNPNIGLYGYCNNKYCILGRDIPAEKAKLFEKALGVPVHQMNICGTSMVGIFVAGNSGKLLVPHIILDNEIKQLEDLGIDYEIIETDLTALGNNILCNDKGCIVNPDFSVKEKNAIEKALGVPVKTGRIAGLETVGSLAALNSRGCVICRDMTAAEAKLVKEVLGLKAAHSTVNMGSQYIRSGLLCNDKGFIIGDASGGPEIVNIEEELGFLDIEKPKRRQSLIKKPRIKKSVKDGKRHRS